MPGWQYHVEILRRRLFIPQHWGELIHVAIAHHLEPTMMQTCAQNLKLFFHVAIHVWAVAKNTYVLAHMVLKSEATQCPGHQTDIDTKCICNCLSVVL